MSPSLAHQVVGRFRNRTATVVHRDGDLVWGWFASDAPPRMHLKLVSQTPYENGIVWLEDRGRRTASSTGLPREITRPLFDWIWEKREEIEQRWLRFMDANGWLSVRVTNDQLQLVCYPGEPTEFARPINAAVWIDERYSHRDAGSRSARRTR